MVTTDYPQLEGYLLDPKAIVRAFPVINLPLPELEARLEPALTMPDHKNALNELLTQFRLGEYDSSLGARIAEAMEQPPPWVRQFFEQIEASSKAYWKI